MPVPDRPGLDRRRFLQRAALVAGGAPLLAAVLDACSRGERPAATPNLRIAAPDKPVMWDIAADNTPIANGLGPEKGATLRLYSYSGYVSTEAIASFERKYDTNVEISTFNSTDEALTRIRAGKVDYDVFTPGYDQLGRLVTGGLLRPLNHSYIPNITNLWPFFTNPWYDREWRYTVPYIVYTTGIGWRADEISADIAAMPNPYAALWDPAYKNRVGIIDDYRTAIAMVLLKIGITDVNTASAEDLSKAGQAMADLKAATAPAITATMFSDLPAGLIALSQMWSGDIITARNHLPGGVSPDILRYWFPADGKGLVDNDLLVILRGGASPVLSHLFINHMLDPDVARRNFSATGYQPPQVSISPDSLVGEGFIPENLKAAIVRPEYFDVGYRLLELEPANDDAWQAVWRTFKTGRP